jgi:hypothetical protein
MFSAFVAQRHCAELIRERAAKDGVYLGTSARAMDGLPYASAVSVSPSRRTSCETSTFCKHRARRAKCHLASPRLAAAFY